MTSIAKAVFHRDKKKIFSEIYGGIRKVMKLKTELPNRKDIIEKMEEVRESAKKIFDSEIYNGVLSGYYNYELLRSLEMNPRNLELLSNMDELINNFFNHIQDMNYLIDEIKNFKTNEKKQLKEQFEDIIAESVEDLISNQLEDLYSLIEDLFFQLKEVLEKEKNEEEVDEDLLEDELRVRRIQRELDEGEEKNVFLQSIYKSIYRDVDLMSQSNLRSPPQRMHTSGLSPREKKGKRKIKGEGDKKGWQMMTVSIKKNKEEEAKKRAENKALKEEEMKKKEMLRKKLREEQAIKKKEERWSKLKNVVHGVQEEEDDYSYEERRWGGVASNINKKKKKESFWGKAARKIREDRQAKGWGRVGKDIHKKKEEQSKGWGKVTKDLHKEKEENEPKGWGKFNKELQREKEEEERKRKHEREMMKIKQKEELKRRRIEEEEKKNRERAELKRKKELEEEKRRREREDEKRRRKEEEERKKISNMKEYQEMEERRKKEEEEKKTMSILSMLKKKDQKAEDEKKKKEEYEEKKREEKRKKEEEERKKHEHKKREKEESLERKMKEERKRKEKEEEEKRKKEEKKKKEEEMKRIQEEKKREEKRREELKREEKKREEKKKEEERKKHEEIERRRKEEKKREEDRKKHEEEKLKKEEKKNVNKLVDIFTGEDEKKKSEKNLMGKLLNSITGEEDKKKDQKSEKKEEEKRKEQKAEKKAIGNLVDIFTGEDEKKKSEKNLMSNLISSIAGVDEKKHDKHHHDEKKSKAQQNEDKKVMKDVLGALGGFNDSPTKTKKKSPEKKAIHLDDDDDFNFDDDEDFGGILGKYSPKKEEKHSPKKQHQKSPDEEIYDEDFDNFSEPDDLNPNKNEAVGLQPKPLINEQRLKLVNNNIKTNMPRIRDKPSIESYNNYETFILLFEEFISQGKCFFYSYEESDYFLDIVNDFHELKVSTDNKTAFEQIEDKLGNFLHSLQATYSQVNQNSDLSNVGRIFLPFDICKFGFYLVEISPICQTIFFYYNEKPKTKKEILLEFDSFIILLEESFGFSEFAIKNIQLNKSNLNFLFQYNDQIYIRYILTLYYLLYEVDFKDFLGNPEVELNENLLERMIWVGHSMKNIYETLENKPDDYKDTFERMIKRHSKVCDTFIFNHESMDIEDLQIMISSDFKKIIKASHDNENVFVTMKAILGETSFSYYLHVGKGKNKKYEINFFFFDFYEDAITEIYLMELLKFEDKHFGIEIYSDFSRHNSLYDYTELSLGVWVGLVFESKYSPVDALSLAAYSFLPNFYFY